MLIVGIDVGNIDKLKDAIIQTILHEGCEAKQILVMRIEREKAAEIVSFTCTLHSNGPQMIQHALIEAYTCPVGKSLLEIGVAKEQRRMPE